MLRTLARAPRAARFVSAMAAPRRAQKAADAAPVPSAGTFRRQRGASVTARYHRISPATAERPWGVVDPTTAYVRDVSTRVCDVRSIMGKVVLGRLTNTRAMAMFFQKN